jgi:hypothetical protein
MAVTFQVQTSAGNLTKTFVSPYEMVRAMQQKIGVAVDGNAGPNTMAALSARADGPTLGGVNWAEVRTQIFDADFSGNADHTQLASMLLTAFYDEVPNSPVTGVSLMPADLELRLRQVAPGRTSEAQTGGRTTGGRTTTGGGTGGAGGSGGRTGTGDGRVDPSLLAGSILGMPRNVFIGVAVGAGVLVVGGIAVAALAMSKDDQDAALKEAEAMRARAAALGAQAYQGAQRFGAQAYQGARRTAQAAQRGARGAYDAVMAQPPSMSQAVAAQYRPTVPALPRGARSMTTTTTFRR